MKKFNEAILVLPSRLQSYLQPLPKQVKEKVQEIRLRAGKPLVLTLHNRCVFVTENGVLENPSVQMVVATGQEVLQTFHKACGYSVHSVQNNIAHGFLTIQGGHRVGLCGTAVIKDHEITNIKDISALNIRIARQMKNVSLPILNSLYEKEIPNLLIAGPPSSGKTTLLRDMAYQLSSGFHRAYRKVVVVDERSELAAVYNGQEQNEAGINCDVLDGFPKGTGIQTALRVLSPQIIICDEIGESEEIQAIRLGLHSGVRFVLSVHAETEEDFFRRPQVQQLLETQAFDDVVILSGSHHPTEISKMIKVRDVYGENNRSTADYSVDHLVRNRSKPAFAAP